MKRLFIIILGLALIIVSCKVINDLSDDTLYNVIVLGRGMDCGNSFLIKFEDDDLGLPRNTFDSIFYEINLPKKYKIKGLKIRVSIRDPRNDELKPCTAMGPGYPHIFITKVE